ncbi:hypothetical protein Sjap_019734 [Stephania japonica]|uniref:Uncharacterized protein n=1 Tax=Stephania japonica TaxID=461633 RepID=A0AAP0HZT0_9MAGN
MEEKEGAANSVHSVEVTLGPTGLYVVDQTVEVTFGPTRRVMHDKENVDPQPHKTGDPVKAFVDEEAEEEDDSDSKVNGDEDEENGDSKEFNERTTQSNKEWRPKSSQNSSLKNHGITGMDTNTISSTPGNSLNSSIKAERLPENFLKFNILENQHVIIPEHLQVPEAERAMLTFGSFGSGIDSPRNCAHGEPDGAEQSNTKSCLR